MPPITCCGRKSRDILGRTTFRCHFHYWPLWWHHHTVRLISEPGAAASLWRHCRTVALIRLVALNKGGPGDRIITWPAGALMHFFGHPLHMGTDGRARLDDLRRWCGRDFRNALVTANWWIKCRFYKSIARNESETWWNQSLSYFQSDAAAASHPILGPDKRLYVNRNYRIQFSRIRCLVYDGTSFSCQQSLSLLVSPGAFTSCAGDCIRPHSIVFRFILFLLLAVLTDRLGRTWCHLLVWKMSAERLIWLAVHHVPLGYSNTWLRVAQRDKDWKRGLQSFITLSARGKKFDLVSQRNRNVGKICWSVWHTVCADKINSCTNASNVC